jgi:hypothetical protein
VGSFVAVTTGVLLRPDHFFSAVRKEGSFAGSVVYAVACGVLAVLLAGVYDFVRAAASGTLDEVSVLGNEGAAGAVLWVLWLLGLSPLYALGTLVVGAAVYQVLVRLIVGRGNAGYGATLRVDAYLSALSLLLWTPVLGLLVGPWGVWMMAAGLREVHSTTTARAVMVAAIPYAFSVSWLVFSVASGQSTLIEAVFGGGTRFPRDAAST